MPKLYVQFVIPAYDACAYYRLQQAMFNSMVNRDLSFTGTHAITTAHFYVGQQVTYLQRVLTATYFKSLLAFKEQSKSRIVIDYDDLLWRKDAMPRYNHALQPEHADKYQAALKEWLPQVADAVTCSTEYLAQELRKYHDNVVVIPNMLSKQIWDFDRRERPQGVRLFYAGSPTHYSNQLHLYGDWQVSLANYAKKAGIDVMGSRPWFLPDAPVETWCGLTEYPRRFRDATGTMPIVLAPLDANDFNRAKSDLKYLECAAVSRVCLVSDFDGSPYSGAHRLQKFTKQSSIKDIEEAVENCCQHYGEILDYQHEYLSHRWLEDNMWRYEELFESII